MRGIDGSPIIDALKHARFRLIAAFNERTRARLGRLGLTALVVWTTSSLLLWIVEPPSANSEFQHIGDYFWGVIIYLFSGLEEYVPATNGGKLIVGVTLVAAAVFLTVFTAEIVALLVELGRRRGLVALKDKKLDFADHVVICGWSDIGPSVIANVQSEVLAERRIAVVVSRIADQIPLEMLPRGTRRARSVWGVDGDATDMDTLCEADADSASCVIVLSTEHPDGDNEQRRFHPSDARTIKTVLAMRALNPDVPVLAEVESHRHAGFLRDAGATATVSNETVVARLLAQAAMKHGSSHVFLSLLTASSQTCEPYVACVPSGLAGMAFGVVSDHMAERGLASPAILTEGRGMLVNPPREEQLSAGDSLLVFSSDQAAATRVLAAVARDIVSGG